MNRRAWLAVTALLALTAACGPAEGPGVDDTVPGDDAVHYVALGDSYTAAPGTGEPVSGGLPDMTLPCLGGGPDVALSSLRGPMLINLWQARCEPCRLEMPALEEFHQQYGDRVRLVGIDFNDVHPDGALALAEETGVTYPSVADPGGELMVEDAFAIARRGLPAFVFVDETGKVVGQDSGGVESVDEVRELVAEHLGIDL